MSKKQEIPADVLKMSFEQAMEELDGIVARLEAGEVPLEQSIEIYQRGNVLRAHCENKLKEAQLKIDKITKDGAGTEPFDTK